MVAWGEADNVTLQLYQPPAALAAAKNPAWVNAQIPGTKRIEDMGPDKTAYQWAAKPVPQDVAAATGLTASAKLLGRAIEAGSLCYEVRTSCRRSRRWPLDFDVEIACSSLCSSGPAVA